MPRQVLGQEKPVQHASMTLIQKLSQKNFPMQTNQLEPLFLICLLLSCLPYFCAIYKLQIMQDYFHYVSHILQRKI